MPRCVGNIVLQLSSSVLSLPGFISCIIGYEFLTLLTVCSLWNAPGLWNTCAS